MTADSPIDSEPAAAPPRWRRALVAVLVVLSCVLAPLAVATVWVRNLVLDTDRYVETVAPLARNDAIRERIASELATQLQEKIDVQQIASDALPERAQFLAAPLAGAVGTFTERAANKVLESEQFQTVWDGANRRAHDQVERALLGTGKVIETESGKVVLDLSDLVIRVRSALAERGIGIFDKVPVGSLALRFELYDSEQLASAQGAIRLLDRVRLLLPLLMLAFLAIAIWLSPNRRRTVLRWGIGVAVACFVLALGVALARSLYLDAVVPPGGTGAAAGAAFDILVRFLRYGLRAAMALGLIVALVAWGSGPSRPATRLRGLLGGAGARTGAAGHGFGSFGTWIAAHRRGAQLAGLLVTIAALVLRSQITAAALLVAALLLLVYVGVVEFIARASGAAKTAVADT